LRVRVALKAYDPLGKYTTPPPLAFAEARAPHTPPGPVTGNVVEGQGVGGARMVKVVPVGTQSQLGRPFFTSRL